ncbi:hypothetical protein [Nocardioides sp. SYSU D00038]|uniref:hypothetical protein n=1 Tax=Nocardioides sp. SYSU D00038 TaxID=2812554 RepID=UPI001967322A|nr:hypothetical protein [Nocardioides sp. SYSU D00038]
MLGLLAATGSVALAAVVGRAAAPAARLAPVAAAATCAALVASPLFGGSVVNGEVLGLPFVLAGAAAALRAVSRSSVGWAVAAGAAAVSAALVKQSLVDVFLLGLVLLAVHRRRLGGRAVVRLLGAALGGVLLVLVPVAAATAALGTDLVDLFRAVVVFRGEAAEVISRSAPATTTDRLGGVLLALLGSLAPLVAVVLALVVRRPARLRASVPDLRWPAAALVAWELLVVHLGGSYWLHYLMGLVPGMVLLAAAAAQRADVVGARLRRAVLVSYAGLGLSTVVALGWIVVDPYERPEEPAIAYLTEHVRPGDTGLVAFGAANIAREAGLDSDYPHLWSLPVRVLDPRLRELAHLLASDDRPTWVVTVGRSLGTWGVDPAAAAPYLREHYEERATTGRFTIYHVLEES